MNVKQVEKRANEVLAAHGIDRAPVPVERIVQAEGASLQFEAFDGDVSGMLLRHDDRTVIGVNAAHPTTRQRFTIAHELGHYFLHDSDRELFVDRSARIKWRDAKSSTATHTEEIEANRFAAALLMPRDLVEREAERLLPLADSDDDLIGQLSEMFKVSTEAMRYRLENLGVLVPTSF